jgi:hypothetical protein
MRNVQAEHSCAAFIQKQGTVNEHFLRKISYIEYILVNALRHVRIYLSISGTCQAYAVRRIDTVCVYLMYTMRSMPASEHFPQLTIHSHR